MERRLTTMRRAGVTVASRRLRHRVENVLLPDVTEHQILAPHEKGIDPRLSLDVARMARSVVFSLEGSTYP